VEDEQCPLVAWTRRLDGDCVSDCEACKPSWLTDQHDRGKLINADDPSQPQYSILSKLGNDGELRDTLGDGRYFFELYWPDLEGTVLGPKIMWKQSNNPESATRNRGQGYEAILMPYATGLKMTHALTRNNPHMPSIFSVGATYSGYPAQALPPSGEWDVGVYPFGRLSGPLGSDREIILVDVVELWVHTKCA